MSTNKNSAADVDAKIAKLISNGERLAVIVMPRAELNRRRRDGMIWPRGCSAIFARADVVAEYVNGQFQAIKP